MGREVRRISIAALVIAGVSAKQPSRSKVAVLGCFVAPLLAMTI